MDSFESRMNPRFLAESEKGMLWEPRVIESGRELVEGFKEDKKGKRRASVLSSFRDSLQTILRNNMRKQLPDSIIGQSLTEMSHWVSKWLHFCGITEIATPELGNQFRFWATLHWAVVLGSLMKTTWPFYPHNDVTHCDSTHWP